MNVKIIAEVGLLHGGRLSLAKRFIDVLAKMGVDAVKFQTHIAEAETLENAPPPPFFKSEPRFTYFKRTAFTKKQWRTLKKYCDRKKVEFMSSVFSEEAVDLLNSIGVKGFKIPSGEVTNLPLLVRAAKTKKPIYLSSGMSTWKELDLAVKTVLKYNKKLVLFQCTSLYPCPYEKVGLGNMALMTKRYRVPVGFSDHTLTNYAAFAAAAMGAPVIEKHMTLKRSLYGSDAKHAAEPAQFVDLVKGVRAIEKVQGALNKDHLGPLKRMKQVFEKSVVVEENIPKGTVIRRSMIAIKKPGGGLAPKDFSRVLGRRAKKSLKAGTVLKQADVV